MDSLVDTSEKSLNIELKMPRTLVKYLVPNSIFKKEDEILKKENSKVREINLGSMKSTTKAPEVKLNSEAKRREKLSLVPKSVRSGGVKKKSALSINLPEFSGSLFKILKFIKTRALYRSTKNLKDYHYHIINDKAIVTRDTPDFRKPRNFRSIWEKRESSEPSKEIAGLESSFVPLYRIVRNAQKMTEFSSRILGFTKQIPTFDPNHCLKIVWDSFIFLNLILKLLSYSLDRAFVQVDTILKQEVSNFYNIILFVLLIVDLLFTLNTKIYLSGICVSSRTEILWNYFKKYSLIDFTSLLQLLLNRIEHDPMRYLDFNLILLPKLIFCNPDLSLRLKHILIKNNEYIDGIYSLFSLGLKILVSGHIMACLWHYTSFKYSQTHPLGNYWLKDKGLVQEEWQIKYLYSIYWGVTTMLTVGYGDITPKNENEIIFTICSMFIGCVIFGYSLNRIGEILKKATKYQRTLKKKRDHILRMSDRLRLSMELQTKLIKYLEFVQDHEQKINPQIEKQIFSKLSHTLRDEVFRETRLKYLRNVPLLKTVLSEQGMLELSRSMEEKRYMPEEIIYEPNNREEDLYIIVDGEVTMCSRNKEGRNNSTFKLETFGNNEYFGIEEFITGFPRNCRALTSKFTTLLKVNREDFLEVIKKDWAQYEKFCFVRENLIANCNPVQLLTKCSSCGRLDHKTSECPFITYKPNKLIVIGRHIHRKNKRIGAGRKKGRPKCNTLTNNGIICKRLFDFRNCLENDEEFKDFTDVYQQLANEATLDTNLINENKEASSPRDLQMSPASFHKTSTGDDRFFQLRSLKGAEAAANTNPLLSSPSRQQDKKSVAYGKSLTLTRSRKENNEPFFLQSDKLKNFKFFFPRNNSEVIIKKALMRPYIPQTIKTIRFSKNMI